MKLRIEITQLRVDKGDIKRLSAKATGEVVIEGSANDISSMLLEAEEKGNSGKARIHIFLEDD